MENCSAVLPPQNVKMSLSSPGLWQAPSSAPECQWWHSQAESRDRSGGSYTTGSTLHLKEQKFTVYAWTSWISVFFILESTALIFREQFLCSGSRYHEHRRGWHSSTKHLIHSTATACWLCCPKHLSSSWPRTPQEPPGSLHPGSSRPPRPPDWTAKVCPDWLMLFKYSQYFPT